MTKTKEPKRVRFERIKAILTEGGHDDLADTMAHEIELLDKKNASRSKAQQKADEQRAEIGELVISVLTTAEEPMTCSAICKAIGLDISTQKLSPILTNLVDAKTIQKGKEKGKSVYSI